MKRTLILEEWRQVSSPYSDGRNRPWVKWWELRSNEPWQTPTPDASFSEKKNSQSINQSINRTINQSGNLVSYLCTFSGLTFHPQCLKLRTLLQLVVKTQDGEMFGSFPRAANTLADVLTLGRAVRLPWSGHTLRLEGAVHLVLRLLLRHHRGPSHQAQNICNAKKKRQELMW